MAWRAAAVSGRHEPGSRVMLSARYRRAVAEALVWLQGNGNGQGVEPVIDLCGDDGADPAADGDGSGGSGDGGCSAGGVGPVRGSMRGDLLLGPGPPRALKRPWCFPQ